MNDSSCAETLPLGLHLGSWAPVFLGESSISPPELSLNHGGLACRFLHGSFQRSQNHGAHFSFSRCCGCGPSRTGLVFRRNGVVVSFGLLDVAARPMDLTPYH